MIALTGVVDQIGFGSGGHRRQWCRLSGVLLDPISRLPPPARRAAADRNAIARGPHPPLRVCHAAERDWFRLLTTVQGVGARLALAILSAVAPEHLALAIAAQDKVALTRADGVGPRLAARIVNELRDKTAGIAAAVMPAAGMTPDREVGPAEDAVSALVNLGYRRAEAFGAVAAAAQRLGSGAEAGALIRAGLQDLAR